MPHPKLNLAHERAAMERRSNPHPMHRALADHLQRLSVEFVCEKRIGCYYADFCLPNVGLVVELDGANHSEEREVHRDAVIAKADYQVLHFPTTMTVPDIARQIMIWIGENGTDCHRCHNAERVGKRYCRECSAVKQASFRERQLGLPSKPPTTQAQLFYLWPECKTCGNSGYVPAGFEGRYKRCACRAQQPLRFETESAREQAERAQRRIPTPEQRAFAGPAWEQWSLRFSQLAESKDMNAISGSPRRPNRSTMPENTSQERSA